MDGIDQDPATAQLGITPMVVSDWFTPFGEDRPMHAYVAEP
ncbi:hypothetical protein [Streptacidiphilus fuscans]|nr:hypothetical protein [Streptacidiphilus fuscans]